MTDFDIILNYNYYCIQTNDHNLVYTTLIEISNSIQYEKKLKYHLSKAR